MLKYDNYNLSKNNKEQFDAVQKKIKAALVTYVYKQSSIGLIAALFCATILLFAFYEINSKMIFIWYAIIWIVSILRYLLVKIYLSARNIEEDLNLWQNLFIVGAFFSGSCWGLIGYFLPYTNATLSILIIMILAGMTAGAVPLLSGILNASFVFLLTAILPLSIRLLSVNNLTYILFGITSLVYLGYLILLSLKNRNVLLHSVSLQFDNEILLRNLSEAKKQLEMTNKKLEHAATHDHLTNLANRILFESYFARELQNAEREKLMLALMYLDLDKFKGVNDAYGHQIGDILLQKIVERIIRKLPDNAIASRLGGDEITILVEREEEPEKVAELANKLCEVLAEPFVIKGYHILISVSIGISIYPIDGSEIKELLKNADKAMYYIKERGGNNFHFNTDRTTIKKLLQDLQRKNQFITR